MLFVVLPVLGVLWFLNPITFMENLQKGKSTHNQKVLGIFWTLAFIVTSILCYMVLH